MRICLRALAVFLATGVGIGPGHAAVSIQDLVELSTPSQVATSRDGKQVAWVTRQQNLGNLDENESQSRVYLWRQGGFESFDQLKRLITGQAKPKRYRPVTRAGAHAEAPSFSEDGHTLAFLAAWGEDGGNQVWVLPLDGGEAEVWTAAEEGVDSFAWLPNGSIVYLAADPGPPGLRGWPGNRTTDRDGPAAKRDQRAQGFWIVSPTGETKRAFAGSPGIRDFALAWSGSQLIYREHRERSTLHVLDLTTGSSRPLTDLPGDQWNPAWSHDEQTVYCLVADDAGEGNGRIVAVPLDGGEPKPLFTELEGPVVSLASVQADRRLFALVADGTRQVLCKLFPNTQTILRVVDQPGQANSLVVDRSGDRVAFIHQGPGQAPEVARWEYDNRDFEWLTWENRSVSTRADAVHETVRWNAPDGREIEGVLVTPPDAGRPLPTVVTAPGALWGAADAVAGRGYAVFTPNVRELGPAELPDVVAGVDHLVAKGIADPHRLAIAGAGAAIDSLPESARAPKFAIYPDQANEFGNPVQRLEAFEHRLAWLDRIVLGREAGAVGRVGLPIADDTWSLLVRRVEERKSIGPTQPASGRWLVVDLVLTAHVAPNSLDVALSGPDSPFVLVDRLGQELRPVGVATRWNGAAHLLSGESLPRLTADPGRANVSWPLQVVFEPASAEPPGRLHAMNLPPVEIPWTVPEPEPTPKPGRQSRRRR